MDFDYIIMGSGFGGSVSALRLAEKGYRVLVVEKGRRFDAQDFPKTNWHLRKWIFWPSMGFHGFFRIRLFRHLTVLAGAGVGGGSLVYANTLAIPPDEFYQSGTWRGLADWKSELQPHYRTALEMLGGAATPKMGPGDLAMEQLARQLGLTDQFEATRTAVFFGEPEQVVSDPYFSGRGPDREGCRFCGGCMVGCRYNAKNTLDKNYLFLAEKLGVNIQERTEVIGIEPLGNRGGEGYRVTLKGRQGKVHLVSRGVVLSGGVLGTVPLLLKLKQTSMPALSRWVGRSVRTNNEALIGVISRKKELDFSEGVAIGSILQTGPHSHIEPVRYPSGSGFWRLLMAPMINGGSMPKRLLALVIDFFIHPWQNLNAFLVPNWAKHAQILLFMQTIDSTLRLRRTRTGLGTQMESGTPPTAFLPEAQALARQYASIVKGKPLVLPTESLLGIPTTAHILGGACIGNDESNGVIDKHHRVFGYENLYIIDGSSMSANPGVNPSLTITAMAERAMEMIPEYSNPD